MKQTIHIALILMLYMPTYIHTAFRKTISGAGTVIQMALATNLFFQGCAALKQTQEDAPPENLAPIPPCVEAFARTILLREQVPQAHSMPIYVVAQPKLTYATDGRALLIEKKEADILSSCLQATHPYTFMRKRGGTPCCSITTRHTNLEYITQSAASITHESEHIKDMHVQKRIAAACIIPIFTFAACYFSPLGPLISRSFLTKMCSGAGLCELNTLLYTKYSRHTEYIADDAITDPLEIAVSIEEYQNRLFWMPNTDSIHERLHASHPSDYERMKRFAKRAKRLQPSQD